MKFLYGFPVLCALNLIGILILPGLRIGSLNYQESSYWLQIEILYPGADIFTVEKEISIPIENILKQAQGYDNLESHSGPGRSITFLQFSSLEILNEKKRKIRNLIFENLESLPKQANTPKISHTSRIKMPGFAFRFLHPKNEIPIGYEEEIRRFFESLPGINSIQFSERESNEIVVEIFESISKTWKLQPTEILRALNTISFPFVEVNSANYQMLDIGSLERFSKAEIYLPERGKVKLDTISTILLEKKTRNQTTRWNGKEETLLLVYTESEVTNLLLMPKIFHFLWSHPEVEIIFNPSRMLFFDFAFLILLLFLIDIFICFSKHTSISKKSIWYFYSIFINLTSVFVLFGLEFSVIHFSGIVFAKLLYVSIPIRLPDSLLGHFPNQLFSPIEETNKLFYPTAIFCIFILLGFFQFFQLPHQIMERTKQNTAILDFPPGKSFSETNRITRQVEDEILTRGLTKSMTVQAESGQSKFYLELDSKANESQFGNLPSEDGFFYFPQAQLDSEEYIVWFFHENLDTLRNIASETIVTLQNWECFSEVLQLFKPPYVSSVQNWEDQFTGDIGIQNADLIQNQKIKLLPPIFQKVSYGGKLTDVRMRFERPKGLSLESNEVNDVIHLDSFVQTKKEWIPDRIQRKNQSRVLGILIRGVGIDFKRVEELLKRIKIQNNIGYSLEKRHQNQPFQISTDSIIYLISSVILLFIMDRFTNLSKYGIFFLLLGTLGFVSVYINISLAEVLIAYGSCCIGILHLQSISEKKRIHFHDLKHSIFVLAFFGFVILCLPLGLILFHLIAISIVFYILLIKFQFFFTKQDTKI